MRSADWSHLEALEMIAKRHRLSFFPCLPGENFHQPAEPRDGTNALQHFPTGTAEPAPRAGVWQSIQTPSVLTISTGLAQPLHTVWRGCGVYGKLEQTACGSLSNPGWSEL